ncbi:MAG TPA: glycosyltransferase family 4 protein [Thermomicrobiales bacterium]|nr:glycosyltransferase family 4 protein [Thermomicrobiales bacterium]
MRIAMIAPLIESVPPQKYGGTERVVSLLTERLVAEGHRVTLFASADSETSAELVPCSPRSLRLSHDIRDYIAYTIAQLAEVYDRAEEFDVIHNHVDYIAFPPAKFAPIPTVTTTHGRLDLPEVRAVYFAYQHLPLVAISESQRASLPGVNWVNTVYNGVDLRNFHFRPDPGDYLVFLGRISPEKRPDRAIDIARDVGMRLVMAAKVDPVDRAYFQAAIEPLVRDSPLVEFIGEVDEREKDELLGKAYAYLFPIDWPEPFGLTMAEAMATGTPVVAYRAGSVPEVVADGVTGFVCDTVHDMADAVTRIASLDRRRCRERVERLFSPDAMSHGYEHVYAALAQRDPHGDRLQVWPADGIRDQPLPSPAGAAWPAGELALRPPFAGFRSQNIPADGVS